MLEPQHYLGLAAALGALGAAGCAISDVILLARPVSGKDYSRDPPDAMRAIAFPRLVAGGWLGVVSLPLALLALFQVYDMLAPAGPLYALPPVLLLGWMLAVGAASHGTWTLLGRALQWQDARPGADADAAVKDMRGYWQAIYVTSGMMFMVGGLWLGAAIVFGETRYPLWMLFFSPFVLMFPVNFLFGLLPAPLGGWLTPTAFNLVWVIFIVASALVGGVWAL